MSLRLGLGLGAGGGRSMLDSDAMSFISRAGIASGTVSVPQYSSTNVLAMSTAPTSTGLWNIVGSGTWGATSGTLPDGTTGSFGQLTASTTSGPWIRDAGANSTALAALSSSNIYTLSVFLKANTTSIARIVLVAGGTDRTAEFNLSLGTITTTVNGAVASITSAGNGWYRCVVTSPSAGAVTAAHIARLAPTCSVGDSVYYCQPQVELGSSATTYVPTTAAAGLGISGTITVNPRQQIIDFVKGMKNLGLWGNTVCWPLRNFQNSSSTSTARSLGGLGIYDGTLQNSISWGLNGLTSAVAGQHMSTSLNIQSLALKTFAAVLLHNAASSSSARIFSSGNVSAYPSVTTASGNGSIFDGASTVLFSFPNAQNTLGFHSVDGVVVDTNVTGYRNGSFGTPVTNTTTRPNQTLTLFRSATTLLSATVAFPIVSTSALSLSEINSIVALYKTTLGAGLAIP